jgi:hypothetical protein
MEDGVKKEIKVKRKQFPLLPGYAITGYAAQGATFTHAILDIKRPEGKGVGRINPADAYVLLSRMKTLKGLLILRPFTKEVLTQKTNPLIEKEHIRLKRLENQNSNSGNKTSSMSDDDFMIPVDSNNLNRMSPKKKLKRKNVDDNNNTNSNINTNTNNSSSSSTPNLSSDDFMIPFDSNNMNKMSPKKKRKCNNVGNNSSGNTIPKIPKENSSQLLPQRLKPSTVPTNGDGNCFFHSAFGNSQDDFGLLMSTNADIMRQSFVDFLNHFTSITNVHKSLRPYAVETLKHWFDGGNFPPDLRHTTWVSEFKKKLSLTESTNISKFQSVKNEIKQTVNMAIRTEMNEPGSDDSVQSIIEVIEEGILNTHPSSVRYQDKVNLESCGDFLKWFQTFDGPEAQDHVDNTINNNLTFIAVLLGGDWTDRLATTDSAGWDVEQSMMTDSSLWGKFVQYVRTKGRSYFLSMPDVAFISQLSNQTITVSCPTRTNAEPTHEFTPLPETLTNTDGKVFRISPRLFPTMNRPIQVVHNGQNHFERLVDSSTTETVSDDKNSRTLPPRGTRSRRTRVMEID